MTIQGRSPALQPPISKIGLKVSKEDSFDLRCIEPTKVLFLLRFFLTKLYSRGEDLEDFENLALHLLALEFESIKDPNLINKYNLTWLRIRSLILIFRKGPNALSSSDQAKLEIFKRSPGLFLSPRAFLGQEIQTEEKLFKRYNRRLKKIPPPQAYIGVGYRDKGNARKRHLDGSPSWQEISSTGNYTEHPKRRISILPFGVNGSISTTLVQKGYSQ